VLLLFTALFGERLRLLPTSEPRAKSEPAG
jgi:hypothetical protein